MSLEERIDPDKQEKAGPATNAFEELVTEIRAKREGQPEKEAIFWVVVNGHRVGFRRPTSCSEFKAFKKGGLKFMAFCVSPEGRSAMGEKVLAGRQVDDFIAAYTLHFWSCKETKLSQKSALDLTHETTLCDRLVSMINREFDGELRTILIERIEAKKKPLKKTSSGKPNSRSPRKPTAATTTS